MASQRTLVSSSPPLTALCVVEPFVVGLLSSSCCVLVVTASADPVDFGESLPTVEEEGETCLRDCRARALRPRTLRDLDDMVLPEFRQRASSFYRLAPRGDICPGARGSYFLTCQVGGMFGGELRMLINNNDDAVLFVSIIIIYNY